MSHSIPQEALEASSPEPEQASGGGDVVDRGAQPVYGLLIEYPETGRVSLVTFESAALRGYYMVALSAQQPRVVLRPVSHIR